MSAIPEEGAYAHQRKETYDGLGLSRGGSPHSRHRAKTLRCKRRIWRNYTARRSPICGASRKTLAPKTCSTGEAARRTSRTAPFTFESEDLEGTNPKFDVRDADGVKWKIKLGAEARPETAASRFVWAVGYHTDEDYFLPMVQVDGMPSHVHRGEDLIEPGGVIRNVRLKREEAERRLRTGAGRTIRSRARARCMACA